MSQSANLTLFLYFIIYILIIVLVVYFIKAFSPNAKAVRAICKGKTAEQTKVIEYFLRKGCMIKTISDEDYSSMVNAKEDSLNFKQKALAKIGLDEDQVNEISPVMFEGYVYKNAYAKKRANGSWVSSSYQVSWVFFSSTQVYLYSYTFNPFRACIKWKILFI